MEILISGVYEHEFRSHVESVLIKHGFDHSCVYSKNRVDAQKIIDSQEVDLMFLGGTEDLRYEDRDDRYESGRKLARSNANIPSIMLVYPMYETEWLQQSHPPNLTLTFSEFEGLKKESLELILSGENGKIRNF
jgi:hypothetical protein